MKDHLERVHPDKKNKDVEFFKVLKEKTRNKPNLKSFFKAPGQSYTIGEEIVIPAIKEVIETVMKKDFEPVLKCITLSAKTVQRRIDEMASNIYSQRLKYVVDEILFANYLKGDAKGETSFRSLEDYLKEHNVPLRNITAVATDGAPAIVGRYRGFATLLKETVHFNKIKGQPLNSRLFATLCEKNDETFNQLLFHTEVRWLSRGDCLQRLVDLHHSTAEFLADVDQTLCEEMKKCKNHLFYLADLYSKFNEIQKRLQGKDKLDEGVDVSDRDLEIYINHLEKLEKDFKIRFEDL
ncbi:Zinc finger BED domain-containing protein 5 [Trichinella pseudospiralis]|uniref:Zinc finger BED domain-containing protein 5 n=1 Tax=Trichinella pseudospiralis TaxID=6337 RepID=A0A0V1E603_TRIPS|nr:Zinc finger BED domain-containing protein 5 [Trichinella pseudospiralis]KRZ31359.1 Zinc finger BED domain-containing protein 5 [Trichinella pseudospiralis]